MAQESGRGTPLAQATEAAIREGIIEGRYAPGARLRERELSEELGVSRLPVREALRNLRYDGFITTTAHKGATVRTMSVEAVDELFDLRIRLEPFAAEEAARRHARGDLHEGLEQAIAAADAATQEGSLEGILLSTAHFHAQIIDAARHELLAELMAPILGRTRWLFAMTTFRDPHPELQAHYEIYHAIRDGDPALAGMRMAAHIEAGRGPSLRAGEASGTDDSPGEGGASPPC
ncbi:GntR family transcriptional regulator, partial [Brevibacterium sp.]|uniref:GntR family transcriptional regulator n=1 Tax=Brevibacterium sp. TaxID=1701 RepID=UPI0025C1FCC5